MRACGRQRLRALVTAYFGGFVWQCPLAARVLPDGSGLRWQSLSLALSRVQQLIRKAGAEHVAGPLR